MAELETERELLLTVRSDTTADFRVTIAPHATVEDLVAAFGYSASERVVQVHSRLLSPRLRLVQSALMHGDELELLPPRRHPGRARVEKQTGPIVLTQLDGRDRGRVIAVAEGEPVTVWLIADGDQCRTRIARTTRTTPSSSALRLSFSASDGVKLRPFGTIELDGEGVENEVTLRVGSVVTLTADFDNPAGHRWKVTFDVTDHGRATSGLNGWVPYRVITSGKSEVGTLDESEIRVGPKPREPEKRSVTDYIFELLPAIGLVALMVARGSAIVYGLLYLGIYGIRVLVQLRNQQKAFEKYDTDIRTWQKQLDDAIDRFGDHIIKEHAERVSVLQAGFSSTEVWRSLNRMDGLWQRARDNKYFLSVWIGNGRWRSDAVFPMPSGLDHDEFLALQDRTNNRRFIDVAPIAVDLARDHLAVVGPRTLARQAVNLILADLAANHSPVDMRFVLLLPAVGTDIDEFVSWAKWLPHVGPAAGLLSRDRIHFGFVACQEWLREFRGRVTTGGLQVGGHPSVVLVVHEASEPDIALLEDVVRLSEGRVRVVWWGSAAQRVPALISNRILIEGFRYPNQAPVTALLDSHDHGWTVQPSTPSEVMEEGDKSDAAASGWKRRILLRSTSSADKLRAIARSMAPLADERSNFESSSIPSAVPLNSFVRSGMPLDEKWDVVAKLLGLPVDEIRGGILGGRSIADTAAKMAISEADVLRNLVDVDVALLNAFAHRGPVQGNHDAHLLRITTCEQMRLHAVGEALADVDSRDRLQTAWRTSSAAKKLVLRLGVGATAVVAIDLAALGPHMLVGGTTGSGKSEFLQSIVADAVARYDASELQLCLIDFKGGASFDSFAGIEHLAAEASNLDPRRMDRAISFLYGELDYRMSLLRDESCKDFDEYRERVQVRLPRMLVVLDEYAAAQAAFPEVRKLTDSIAARGRSLGVHVIFATQNPSGAVTADMETNIGARVCLRMLSEADAKSVVMDPAPARIPIDLPGRAFIRLPDGDLREFQAPFANAPIVAHPKAVTVARFF